MANELSYSSDDLYGQYGYEGGQNVTFSALDAIISNLKVSSAQIENLAVTDAHIKELNASKLKAGSIIAGDITFTGVLSGASGTFSGDLTGSHGNFEEVRVSQEFGGIIKIGTGRFSASGSVWTPTGDAVLSSDLYERAIKLSHEDAGSFDFNIAGNLRASSLNSNGDITADGDMRSRGYLVLKGLVGYAEATYSAATRLRTRVVHNWNAGNAPLFVPNWFSGCVGMDSVNNVYMENWDANGFDIVVAGSGFAPGAKLAFSYCVIPT